MRWFWRSNPFVKNSRRNFLMERIWKGLTRGVWNRHPWRCLSNNWTLVWPGGQMLDLMTLQGFSKMIPRFGIHLGAQGDLGPCPCSDTGDIPGTTLSSASPKLVLIKITQSFQNEFWLKLLRGFRAWRTSRVTSTPLECALLPHPLHPRMQRALTPIRGRMIPFGRDWTQIWGLCPNCVSDTGGATFLRVTEGKQTQRSAPVSFGTRMMPKGFFAMRFETKGDFGCWVCVTQSRARNDQQLWAEMKTMVRLKRIFFFVSGKNLVNDGWRHILLSKNGIKGERPKKSSIPAPLIYSLQDSW